MVLRITKAHLIGNPVWVTDSLTAGVEKGLDQNELLNMVIRFKSHLLNFLEHCPHALVDNVYNPLLFN